MSDVITKTTITGQQTETDQTTIKQAVKRYDDKPCDGRCTMVTCRHFADCVASVSLRWPEFEPWLYELYITQRGKQCSVYSRFYDFAHAYVKLQHGTLFAFEKTGQIFHVPDDKETEKIEKRCIKHLDRYTQYFTTVPRVSKDYRFLTFKEIEDICNDKLNHKCRLLYYLDKYTGIIRSGYLGHDCNTDMEYIPVLPSPTSKGVSVGVWLLITDKKEGGSRASLAKHELPFPMYIDTDTDITKMNSKKQCSTCALINGLH